MGVFETFQSVEVFATGLCVQNESASWGSFCSMSDLSPHQAQGVCFGWRIASPQLFHVRDCVFWDDVRLPDSLQIRLALQL